MLSTNSNEVAAFRRVVWHHAGRYGRYTLPWRGAHTTAYHVLVSEAMLQQTQVDRVVPYYRAFIGQFPNVRTLAEAPLSSVLVAWQGLGYNRRAKRLHEAAQRILKDHGGRVPKDITTLETLPGIGPYTARATAAFAYNTDTIFVETNIRTAIIYHFCAHRKKVCDADIKELLVKALPQGRAKEWYAALMDYGAHLKRSGVRVNTRVSGYAKQKPFSGSDREARGTILKVLATSPRSVRTLANLLGTVRKPQLTHVLSALRAEGMVVARKGRYALPGDYP